MRRLLLLTLLVALYGPGRAVAQVEFSGKVLDNRTLQGIGGAEVRVIRAGQHSTLISLVTGPDGRFHFVADEDGGYSFRASRIGYAETTTPVLWTDGYRTYQVEIRLDPDAVLIAPIEVVARSRTSSSPILDNFEHRRTGGTGHYFTHQDVERIKPARVTDLLTRVPGLRLRSSGAGLRRVVYMSRGGQTCPAEIFVDGRRWTRPGIGQDASSFTVDDAVSPSAVLGIEVYLGLATVPAEFLTPRSRCGVVAIWTRR